MANEKRLIEVNSLIAYFEEQCDIAAKDTEIESAYVLAALKCCIDLFQNFPIVDAVEVVRCKDCKHSYDGVANLMCGRCGQNINVIRLGGVSVKEEHFCSYGEREDK